jgi:hypothetical protein
MKLASFVFCRTLVAASLLIACSNEASGPSPLPEEISTPDRLRALVEALAHDSARGRAAGSAHELSTAQYLAEHASRIGLTPHGQNGTFFQTVPAVRRRVEETSAVSVGADPLELFTDFVPGLPATSAPRLSWDADAVWAGTFVGQFEPLPAGVDAIGRVVVLEALAGGGVLTSVRTDGVLAGAAAVVIVVAGPFEAGLVEFLRNPPILHGPALRSTAAAPIVLVVTRDVAEVIMNAPLGDLEPGDVGLRVQGNIAVGATDAIIRNVIASLPGADPALVDEYIAIGAHYDAQGAHGDPAAGDVIYNGADDNASGTAALIALAEHFAQPAHRPRRSLTFMWWAAEEIGLVGSEWFSQSPTVPPDDIAAYVNVDMISRGGATDIANGGPGYLESIGSRRRSTQLATLVDSVATAHRFQLDYTLDAPDHPERVYCRSDHWNLARLGVPVVFFSTGTHEDYHKVTDEPERSDFTKLERVTTFVAGVMDALSERATAIARDLPAPTPGAPCVQ